MNLGHTERDNEEIWLIWRRVEERMQWKELPENAEKFCICGSQGIRIWRPVFARKVTPKCSRDPLAPEDGL